MSRVGEKPWWSEVVGGGLVNVLAGVLLLRFFKDGWMIFGSALVMAGFTILFFRGMHLRKDANDDDPGAAPIAAAPTPAVTGPNHGVNAASVVVHGNLTINNQPIPTDGEPKKTKAKKSGAKTSEPRDADAKTGDVNVTGNTAPTMVNIGGSGNTNTQVVHVNVARKFRKTTLVSKPRQDPAFENDWIMSVTFELTDGVWETGQPVHIKLKFDGPFMGTFFERGMPSFVAYQHNSAFAPDHPSERGEFEIITATPPLPNEPIVLLIRSKTRLKVTSVEVAPRESD